MALQRVSEEDELEDMVATAVELLSLAISTGEVSVAI